MVPDAILEEDEILEEVENHASPHHMPGVHFAPVC